LFHYQRQRQHDLRRAILDAIFYLLKTGCQWCMLPREFAPWQTVYYYFRRWKQRGLIRRMHAALRQVVRLKAGRETTPSLAIIDCQSVKTTRRSGERGYDGKNRINGRKRHIVIDTLGLLWAVVVHRDNGHDSQMAPQVLKRLWGSVPRRRVIVADQGYNGTPPGLVARVFGWLWHVVRRDPE
jgi:putative transposase